MAHWAAAPLDRNQIVLFSPTLDQSIADDHPVRLLAETLDKLDFAPWEAMYFRLLGQPPIHPRVLAAAILYGLSLGIRSSRKLQDASANRLDFIWLLEGRVPDHATICAFRTRFGQQIKDLFRQVGRVAIELGLVAFNQVMLDGTDIKSNNSRYATNRQASLTRKIQALDQQVERLLAEADVQDKSDAQLLGEATPGKLPRELRDLRRRQDRLEKAMENLSKLQEQRRQRKDQPKAAAIPTTDPESRVLPGKQGGYAPAYTAVLATDAQQGFIVDVQVMAGNDEPATLLAAVEGIQESFNRKPEQLIADCGFNTGANLAGLAEQQIEALMPPRQPLDASAAQRPDPVAAVAEAQRVKLPINPQNKKLDRSAFVYDAKKDRYHCPMGQALERVADKPYNRHGHKGKYQVYQCVNCADCPLAGQCLMGKSPVRRICRDEHETLREQMAKRMGSEAGAKAYRQRGPVAETPFASIKSRLNLRQFLLRGLKKVRIELDWAVTALNVTKLMHLLAR